MLGKSLAAMIVTSLFLTATSFGATLYCDGFTSTANLVADSGVNLTVGPAPGGKAGTALLISNPTNTNGKTVTLTPGPALTFPNSVSIVFRVYLASYNGTFMAIYNYAPGEGLRFLPGGALQGSCGESLPGTWQTGTWYTIALVLSSGGNVQLYAKPGATATLDPNADGPVNICGSGRPLTHTTFFNYGGDMYIADYTVNDGLDLTIGTCSASNNDACANATPLVEGVAYAGSTASATNDGTATCGTSNTSPDVWFKYTAVRTGNLILDTCGSSFDTVLSVHTACPGTAANQVASACNDNCGGAPCSGPPSCLTAPITAGTSYYVRVAGVSGATGTYALHVNSQSTMPFYSEDFETGPAGWGGDGNFWSATGGVNNSAYVGGTRTGASSYLEPLTPPASNDLRGNVRARFGNLIRFSYYLKDINQTTAGNKAFYVFSGGNIWQLQLGNPSLADWTKVSFEINTDWTDAQAQAAGWDNTAWNGGNFASVWQNITDYNFLSSGGSGTVVTGVDNVLVGTIATLAPTNDNCASAEPLAPGGEVLWTTFAAKDGSSACGAASTSPDRWYSYTAPSTGELHLDTCGSLSDTVLSIQSACGAGHELTCNDNCSSGLCAGPSSCAVLSVIQGNTYLIRVSNGANAVGNVVLNVRGIRAGLPYVHNFTDLHDISGIDTAGGQYDVGIGSAPNSTRQALHIKELSAGSGTAVSRLIPNAWLPTSGLVTYQYRLYAEDRGGGFGSNGPLYAYLGTANLAPGTSDGTYIYQQKIRMANNGATILDPIQANTWYTIGILYDLSTHSGSVYAAPGDVNLTPADLKATNINWNFSGAPGSMSFFGGNGDGFYMADFSIRAGDAISPAVQNDNCGAAQLITNGTYAGTTTGATADGESICSGSGSFDVWYAYNASCSNHLNVILASATFDAVLSIHSGCPGTTSNQLACGAAISVPVQTGKTYLIRVASLSTTGRGDFSFTTSCGPSPTDPTCGQDFNSGLGGWVGGSNDGGLHVATGGVNNSPYEQASRTTFYPYHEPYYDPDRSYLTANLTSRFGNIVEYSYYVKDLSASTPGAGPVSHSFGWTPPGGAYTQWAVALLPSYPTDWTKVSFDINLTWTDDQAQGYGWIRQTGTAHWADMFQANGVSGTDNGLRCLAAASLGAFGGTRVTGIDCVSVKAGTLSPPPANDACGNAQAIVDGVVSGTTLAGSNDGDATCGGTGTSADVWYAYTATCSDHLKVKLTAATFAAVISAHSGCPGNTGNELACNSLGLNSTLNVAVTQGQTYYIRVAGAGGAVGTFTLDVSCGALPPPQNHLYCHNFGDMHDITIEGTPTLTPGIAAPDGKAGKALKFVGASGSYITLTPSGVALAPASTTVFRIYITSRTDFMGAYSYPPKEGLRFLAGGVLQNSNNQTLSGTWAPNTWYTVGLGVPGTGAVNIYFKEGATTQLTEADLIGGTSGTSGPMDHTVFFNYGGEYYLADYTVNAFKNGVPDFTICGEEAGSVCGTPWADADQDHDVDQDDFALFQACYTGSSGVIATGCECLDRNKDSVIDGLDQVLFERCASGPDVPVNPACEN